MVEKKLVCVLIPCAGSMPTDFVINLMSFITHNMQKHEIDVNICKDIPIDKARNSLVRTAMSKNPDYMMWIDSDNVLPVKALDKLIEVLEEKKAGIVTALYFEKAKPYYPVIRQYHSDGFWKIENPPLGKIFEIAGCGMGSCLMRPDVFEHTEYPWFKFSYETWGYKDVQLSEDLYFCRQLVKKGIKMYCHSGIISAHLGSSLDAFEYMSMAKIRSEAEQNREELIKDMVGFTKETEREINLRVMVGPDRMSDEWNKKDPKTGDEIRKFYKETENYLYDLSFWHFTNRRQFDVELVTAMTKQVKPKNVLDFGCGIGQNSIMLAREGISVTMAELDGYTFNFAKERFRNHKVPFKSWEVDLQDSPPDEKYDVILCFDVLEHLPADEMKKVVEKLISLKHKDTKVLYTASFGKTDAHPMHFDASKEAHGLLQRLLKEHGQ